MALDFPDFPTLNEVFNDPISGRYWRWDGEKWLSFDAGLSDTASLSMSEIPPLLPEVGDLWFESDTTRFYVYFDGVWVEIQGGNPGIQGPTGPTGPTGPAGTNGTSAAIPTGVVSAFAGSSAPSGYVICDGTSYSRTDPLYSALFGVIGVTYGSANSSSFNVPDLRTRVPVGFSSSDTDTDPLAGVDNALSTLGKTGGSKTHTLSQAQLPSHTHTVSQSAASATSSITVWNAAGGGAASNSVTGYSAAGGTGTISSGGTNIPGGEHTHSVSVSGGGSNNAHNILQPYIVMNYIIKL